MDDLFTRKTGDGNDTFFWLDRWVGGIPLKKLFPDLFDLEVNKNCTIASRFSHRNDDGATWNWPWTNVTFTGRLSSQIHELEDILKQVELVPSDDGWRWEGDPNGEFTVKSLRSIIDNLTYSPSSIVFFWNKWLPSKVNCFVWRLLLNRIPTRSNLCARGIALPSELCPVCGVVEESVDHLFYSCPLVKEIWKWMASWCNIELGHYASLELAITGFLECGKSKKQSTFLEAATDSMLWSIWKARNNMVFNNQRFLVSAAVIEIQANLYTWVKYRGNCQDLVWPTWCCNPISLF